MPDRRTQAARRGRDTLRANRQNARERKEAGLDDLNKVIEKAEGERPGVVAQNVGKFFERKEGPKGKPWETETEGLGPGGEKLTLEDLIYLKPFAMEDLNATISFRANEKMMRAFQRVKEASGGVYDILSDLYRDCAIIGLLVLSERHKSILGLEIVISRAESHQRLKEDAADTVLRLKEALRPLSEDMRKVYFHSFIENLGERPRWIQETILEEIRGDRLLSDLMRDMEEGDTTE